MAAACALVWPRHLQRQYRFDEYPDNPGHGYKIVFDEETGNFGLASAGDCIVGFYGSFMEAFHGM